MGFIQLQILVYETQPHKLGQGFSTEKMLLTNLDVENITQEVCLKLFSIPLVLPKDVRIRRKKNIMSYLTTEIHPKIVSHNA